MVDISFKAIPDIARVRTLKKNDQRQKKKKPKHNAKDEPGKPPRKGGIDLKA